MPAEPRASTDPDVARLAEDLRRRGAGRPELAIVLGSGLGAFADELEDARAIPFGELDAMPASSVPGHAGRFVAGRLAGRALLVQQGRVHAYEGWSARAITRSTRAFAALGCRGLLLTNAAGGLDASLAPGALLCLTDHVNLQGRTPLARGEAGRGSPYDPRLATALERAAADAGVELASGTYVGVPGPSYESPAEIRWFARTGARAVGMSTVLEAVAAHAAGLRVAALSCVTNHAAGIQATPLSHAEVLESGRRSAGRFARLLRAAVPALCAELASAVDVDP